MRAIVVQVPPARSSILWIVVRSNRWLYLSIIPLLIVSALDQSDSEVDAKNTSGGMPKSLPKMPPSNRSELFNLYIIPASYAPVIPRLIIVVPHSPTLDFHPASAISCLPDVFVLACLVISGHTQYFACACRFFRISTGSFQPRRCTSQHDALPFYWSSIRSLSGFSFVSN
jgi:hypothetical protein